MVENNIQISELDAKAFEALLKDALILSRHGILGPKVFILPFGDIVKVFNPKKGLTRRHWHPKYRQFIENAAQLHIRHIKTVAIRHIYHLSERDAYAVRYTPLAGRDLRSLMPGNMPILMPTLLDFMASLHDKGIYFRGLHLGNILNCDTGGLGIIDMADMRFKNGSLNMAYRVRNLAHMVKRPEDCTLFESYGLTRLLDEYCAHAGIRGLTRIWFNILVNVYFTYF